MAPGLTKGRDRKENGWRCMKRERERKREGDRGIFMLDYRHRIIVPGQNTVKSERRATSRLIRRGNDDGKNFRQL